MQGWKLAVMIYHVLDSDSRFVGLTGDLAPDKFNPERWFLEGGQRTGAYMPFGSGVRMCLGYILAQAEIKVQLSSLTCQA